MCKRLTTDEFILKSKLKHYDKYDYSNVEYINAKTKVEVICKIHGSFFITPNDHDHGRGCPICGEINRRNSKSNSHNYFVSKSNIVHSNKYDYSKCEYKRQSDLLTIICPIHGEFIQTAKDHLSGSGCIECARKRISTARSENPTGWKLSEWIQSSKVSAEFDSYKIYIIECFNDNERFIKIGRTYRTVRKRFRTESMMPYEFNVLHQINGNPFKIFKLESILKNKYKDQKYIPKLEFNGMQECFNINTKELIISEYVNT